MSYLNEWCAATDFVRSPAVGSSFGGHAYSGHERGPRAYCHFLYDKRTVRIEFGILNETLLDSRRKHAI